MIAVMECDVCGRVSEHEFAAMDPEKRAPCPKCGQMLFTTKHRRWDLENLQLVGDTVPGGTNLSDYYDEGMGEYVTGRRHRKYLMEKKGLVEYAPDPEMKKHRDEARYIRSQAKPGDPAAAAAARKEYKAADTKRRDRAVDAVFKRHGM